MTLFSKSPYLTVHTKIIMKQVALQGFLEKRRDISRTVATPKMELFVALVSGFQPLTNFTKNPNVGAMGVLNENLQ